MTVSDLINKSVFASIGTLRSPADLKDFLGYYNHNKPFLDNFPEIIYSFNGDPALIEWVQEFFKDSNVTILVSENLGHTFGIFLSELEIFNYTSTLDNIDYVFKFNNDVTITNDFLQVEIEPNKDFYYINNIGLGALNNKTENELLSDIQTKTYFYPQTTHYIIKNNIEYYPDEELTRLLKNEYEVQKQSNPSIQPWHAIEGCDCENMLTKIIDRNNLSISYLLTDKETKSIINLVKQRNIVDGSHKNISYSRLGGLCHYHYINQTILSI